MKFLKKIIVAAVVVLGLGFAGVSAMQEQPKQEQPKFDQQQILELLAKQQEITQQLLAQGKTVKVEDKKEKPSAMMETVKSYIKIPVDCFNMLPESVQATFWGSCSAASAYKLYRVLGCMSGFIAVCPQGYVSYYVGGTVIFLGLTLGAGSKAYKILEKYAQ